MDREMRTDWVLVILLFVAGLFASGQFAKVTLTLEALGGTYPQAGRALPFAVSMVSVMGILFGAAAGAIVARMGTRKVLLTALAGGAVLSWLQSLLPAFPVFMALRVAEGAAHLALVVAAPTLMAAAASHRDRPVVMGLWGMFFGVGFAIAAALVPAAMAAGGLPAVFLGHGVGLAVLAVVLAPRLPRGVAPTAPDGGWIAMHLKIYRSPRRLAPALGFFWHTITFIALLTYLPRFLGEASAALLPLVALVGTFGAGALAGRIAPHRIAMASFALAAAGMLLLAALPEAAGLWIALPLFVVIGLVPGASFAAVPALNAEVADQARANGALAQLGNCGTAASTPLFALTLGAGLAGPAVLTAGLYLCGIAALWLIHRKIAGYG